MNETFVIDASVSLRFILKEPLDIAQLKHVFNDLRARKVTTIAPTIWLYEMLNGLKMAITRKRTTKIKAKKKIPDIFQTAPELFDFAPLAEDAFQIAAKYQLSVYDASYIALAKDRRCKFYTGDENLHEKLKDKLKFVRLVSQYKKIATNDS